MLHAILTQMPATVSRSVAAFLFLALAAASVPVFAAADGVVNVNTADESQLALLPRVGPAIAGRIVELREENGEFQAKEDLLLVRGIGERTFELLEPFVVLEGDTTLTTKVRASDLEASDEER